VNTPRLIPLDADAPFVRAIRDLQAGASTVDAAVDVLLAIEERCGISVHHDLGDRLNGYDGVKRVREGATPFSAAELLRLFDRAALAPGAPEPWELFEARYEDDPQDELSWSEYTGRLFPFLSETQLLISRSDFCCAGRADLRRLITEREADDPERDTELAVDRDEGAFALAPAHLALDAEEAQPRAQHEARARLDVDHRAHLEPRA
jgi:hypothetical protein